MDIYGNKLVNTIETKPLCASSSDLSNQFLCRLRSIAAHRDHFVRRLSVCACVCLSDSHTFLIVTHSYVSQATHAFLGMLPLCFNTKHPVIILRASLFVATPSHVASWKIECQNFSYYVYRSRKH